MRRGLLRLGEMCHIRESVRYFAPNQFRHSAESIYLIHPIIISNYLYSEGVIESRTEAVISVSGEARRTLKLYAISGQESAYSD